jgi:hypothetical protein
MIKLKALLTESSNVEYKTWKVIRQEQDPVGKNHDLTLSCVKCGTTSTCRCMKPKRKFEGICDKCAATPINEYISVTEEKTKFKQPENFDKIVEEPNYSINAGANDWEYGFSGVSVNFGGGFREEYTRIWIKPKLYGDDGGNHVSDEQRKQTKDAAHGFLKDLNKKAKASHKMKNEQGFEKSWPDCFIEVLKKDPEIQKNIEAWGVDKTKWNTAKYD